MGSWPFGVSLQPSVCLTRVLFPFGLTVPVGVLLPGWSPSRPDEPKMTQTVGPPGVWKREPGVETVSVPYRLVPVLLRGLRVLPGQVDVRLRLWVLSRGLSGVRTLRRKCLGVR